MKQAIEINVPNGFEVSGEPKVNYSHCSEMGLTVTPVKSEPDHVKLARRISGLCVGGEVSAEDHELCRRIIAEWENSKP